MAKKTINKNFSKRRKRTFAQDTSDNTDDLSIDGTKNPNYSDIGEERFQDFCKELLAKDPTISTADIYGLRGQTQFGIDIRAVRINGEGLDLGQCKAYRKITAPQIKKASQAFLDHWETKWKEKNVKRFILFVACPLTRTELQDQVDEETKVFKQIGVIYEAWSNSTISQKIQPHLGVAQRYLADPWPERLCGGPSTLGLKESLERYPQTVLDTMSAHLANWATDSSELYLKEWKSAFKRGQGKEAYQKLLQLKEDKIKWAQIPNPTKAKVIRLECRLLLSLDPSNSDLIKSLSNEANQLAGNNYDLCLEAIIAGQIENDRAIALEILSQPKTPEETTLKAAFYIEEGLYGDAKEILLHLEDLNNSEKVRLEAYLSLIEKDFDSGLQKISSASSEITELPGIRGVKAKLLYYSAYSPGVLIAPAVSYPMPIHRSLLLSNQKATEALAQSEEIFEKLYREYDGESKLEYALWYFATICLKKSAVQQAEVIAKELLPLLFANSVFISWLMSRQLSPIIKDATVLLDKKIEDGVADIYVVTCRLLIHSAKNEFHLASKLLKSSSSVFGANDVEKIEYWKTEVDILKAKTVTALKKIAKRDLQSTLKIQLVEKWFKISPADADIHTYYSNAPDIKMYPSFLLFAAEISHKQEKWQFIVDNYKDLLKSFPNQPTLELVIDACFKAGRFDLVIRILKENDDIPSHNLMKLRAHAEKMVGNYAEAIKFSEENLKLEMSEGALLYLANILISKGDFSTLKKYVDDCKGKILISVENKVVLANFLAVDFPESSRSLIEEILTQNIQDELVPTVLTLAFEFGLDLRAKHLMKRMYKISARNGALVKTMDTQQLTKIFTDRNDSFQRNFKLFQNVEIPIHLFAAVQRFPIANYINLNLKANEQQSSFFKKTPIYTRYAGRPFSFPPDLKLESVCLDITSLLFLNYFGLLSSVEMAFKRIDLPHSTLLILTDNRRKLLPAQKSRIESKQKILEFCETGSLKKFKKISSTHKLSLKQQQELGADFSFYIDFAKERSGHLVVFNPSEAAALIQNSENLPATSGLIIGIGDIVQTILAETSLSTIEKQQILEKIGRFANERVGVVPARSSSIIFNGNTAEILQNCGLLNKVVNYFDCWISEEEINSIYNEMRIFNNSKDLSSSLQMLTSHLSQKIDQEKYRILPPGLRKSDPNWHLEDDFLSSLLNVSKDQTELVISDDRFLNSFLKASDVEIFSILELAGILRNAEIISDDEFFDIILKLRKANVRFIPPMQEEILNHLPENIQDGETANLKTLRQYLFSCFRDKEILSSNQGNRPPSFTYGELAFYINSLNAINSSIFEIWKSKMNIEEKAARSELIISTLFIDNASMSAIFRGAENIKGHLQLYAQSIIKFFLESMSSEIEDRASFFNWIETKLIKSIVDSTENVSKIIADILIDYIDKILSTMPPERLGQARLFYCRFYEDLPNGIKDTISEDAAFLKRIGISTYKVMSLANKSFKAKEFLSAVRKAYRGKKAQVQCVDSEAKIEIEIQEGEIFFQIEENKKKSKGLYLSGKQFKLCNPDRNEVRRVIESSASDLDLSSSDLSSAIRRIQGSSNLEERINIWNSFAERSYENHILAINDHLMKQQISYPEIVPDAKVVQHYLRIGDNQHFSSIDETLKTLSETFNVTEAIGRLAGLPTDIGQILEEEVKGGDEISNKNLVKRLLKECHSPMGVLHLLRLLSIEKLKEKREYARLRTHLLKKMISDEFFIRSESFLTVLSWVEDRLQTSYQYRTLPSAERTLFAWIISHQTFSQFTKFNVDPKWISENFPKVPSPLSSFIFSKDEMLNDVSYPQYITTQRLISSGLFYGLDGSVPLDNQLATSLSARYFDENGRNKDLALFRSVEAQTNNLHSFLNLSPLMCYQELIGANEKTDINAVCGEWLDDPSNENREIWVLLEMIYGRGRLPDGIKEKFLHKITAVNFVDLISYNRALGLRSFRFACSQHANEVSRDLEAKLKLEALKIVKYFSSEATPTSTSLLGNNHYIHYFLESVIKLGCLSNDPIKNISSFSSIITELSREDFRLFSDLNWYIEKMYWDFPLELRTHISQLITYARST